MTPSRPFPDPISTAPDRAPVVPARQKSGVHRGAWWTLGLIALPVVFSHALVVALRWLPPPTTAFMLQSPVQPVQYRWVPDTRIAGVAHRAVVAAEDQKFWTHDGFDFEAIGKALEHNETHRRKRGASTISQQVAKNLFLWPGRSWLRKGLEVYATALIEFLWSKDRILEVYLNIVEFGPGVYGIEAASRKFFGKPAARLRPEEAARLAAVLPNPRRWQAEPPGPYVLARSHRILELMGYRHAIPLPPETPAAPEAPPEPEPSPELQEEPRLNPEAAVQEI